MPRKKTSARKRRDTNLEKWQEAYLLNGDDTDTYDFMVWNPTETWAEYGPGLLKQWIADHPGTRPFQWWESEAPGNREIIECPEYLKRGQDEVPLEETESYIHGAPYISALDIEPSERLLVESQASFLKRHGLLTAKEEQRLTARDFEPEIIEPDDSGLDDLVGEIPPEYIGNLEVFLNS